MLAISILPILVSFVIGLLIVGVAWPCSVRSGAALLIWLSLAFGLGIGVSSSLYFVWLVIVGPAIGGFILIEIAIVGALLLYLYRRVGRQAATIELARPQPATRSKIYHTAMIAFGTLLMIVVAIEFWLATQTPHGAWDAWAIWNLHARFLFRAGDSWRDTFSLTDYFHPDYPLLISAIVARSWQYIGRETTLVPALISPLFMFATAGLLGSALAHLRSTYHGIVAALLLLGTSAFVYEGASQMSDIALGYFFLATVVMLCFRDRMRAGKFRAALIAGMAAAFAAWTKNEGLLFFIVALLVFCVISLHAIASKSAGERTEIRSASCLGVLRGRLRPKAFLEQLMPFLLGSLPILLIVIYFKAQLPTPGDILAAQGLQATVAKVTDLSRYWLILRAYLEWTIRFSRGAIIVLVAYMLLVGRDPGVRSKVLTVMPASLLVLMLLGYFMVYLTTPYDLAWHVSSSISRLYLQLWPTAVFAAFLVTRTPEHVVSGAGLAESATP